MAKLLLPNPPATGTTISSTSSKTASSASSKRPSSGKEKEKEKPKLFGGKLFVILAELHGETDDHLRSVVKQLGGDVLDVRGGGDSRSLSQGALVNSCDWILVRLEK